MISDGVISSVPTMDGNVVAAEEANELSIGIRTGTSDNTRPIARTLWIRVDPSIFWIVSSINDDLNSITSSLKRINRPVTERTTV